MLRGAPSEVPVMDLAWARKGARGEQKVPKGGQDWLYNNSLKNPLGTPIGAPWASYIVDINNQLYDPHK